MKLLGVNATATAVCRTVDKVDIFGDNSCKALYRLDGNANDESGNYHGTETAITYGGGVYERGAVFNGSSSKVTSVYSIPVNTFSFSCWVKFNTVGTRQPFGTASTAGGDGKFIFQKEASNNLLLGFNTAGKYLTSATTITSGIWYHMVGTCSSTGVYKLYINNILDTTSAAFGNNTAATFQLGFEGATSSYLNGSIDQVRIFNKEISISEVATLYAECAPTSIVDNINPFEDGSLKALYQFNGDATDSTGVYNGSATNVTYSTGKFGNASVITAGKIDLGAGSKALMPHNSSYSVSCWMKKVASQRNVIVSRANTSTNYGDLLFFESAKNFYYEFPSAITTSAGQSTPATTLFDDNLFHHVCFVVNRSTLKSYIYLDGNIFYTGTTLASSYDNNLNTTIGATSNSNLYGNFDQHRFFNKALTPMEVASLYNETTPLEEPMHSLVDPFRDGSGKALYRLEGNALDESGDYNGTATSVTYGAGQFGRCGVFNGTSSKIIFSAISTSQCISFWTNKPLTNGTSKVFFGSNSLIAHVGAGEWSSALTNETLFVWFVESSVNKSIYLTDVINDTTWKHIVLQYVSAGVYNIWVNGVARTVSYYTAGTAMGNFIPQLASMGTYSTGTGNWLDASMDQVRFFNRALTAGEVSTLYGEV